MTDAIKNEHTELRIVDVTITAPDADWLHQHCGMLVERRLAASANIMPAIKSVYRWRGKVHFASESYAVIHTTMGSFPEIIRLTKERHPYEMPHILAREVEAEKSYARWVTDATRVE